MHSIFIKKIALTAIMFVVAVSAFCVPAKRVWRTTTLADGSVIEVMTVGDEHGHWYVDRNGKALSKNTDGKLEYMSDDNLATLKSLRKERMAKINAKRAERINVTRALSAQADATTSGKRKTFGEPTTIKGQKKGLVILVNYNDKSFMSAHNQKLFERRFNEEGYNDNGYIGSVHDYFYDQSYGKFDLTFDVVGPVTVSRNHDYYGTNDKNGDDKYPATMVIEALKLADAQGVDFSKYDWDGDGVVDQVFVIYAGTGEASSNVDSDIWPHEFELSTAKQSGDGSGAQTIDGVKIDTYAVSCELGSSSTIDGIGTAVHEFSHCLGYADLYDTDYSGGQGMMYWDVLDGGSYNGPNEMGEIPAAFTSFERWWAGWMDLTVLDKPQIINNMPALNDEGVAYKIINDAYPNEYYLLENRQAKKWDSYTAGYNDGTGHGMLILHVDYDESVWKENAPNDEKNRQRMTYFPADNSYGTYYSEEGQWGAGYDDLAGDPFPGTKKKTAFTDSSSPAATLYNANTDGRKFMGKPVTDITESNGKISFIFMGGIESPKATDATQIGSDGISFTANWDAVDDADSYDLEVSEISSVTLEPLLSNNFSNVKKKGSAVEVVNQISNWKGSKVYCEENGILKIGSSKNAGYLQTPSINAPSSESVTIKINAKYYGSDNSTITITNGEKATTVKLKKDFTDHVAVLKGINGSFTISLNCAPKKRFYLDSIEIYDGEYTLEDLSNSSAANAIMKAEAIKKAESSTTKLFTGITSTSYKVTGLNAGTDYKYHVRANINGQQSAWSNYIKVISSTAIQAITIDNTDASPRIYSLKGQFMGTDINALPRGIYIIGTRKYIKK